MVPPLVATPAALSLSKGEIGVLSSKLPLLLRAAACTGVLVAGGVPISRGVDPKPYERGCTRRIQDPIWPSPCNTRPNVVMYCAFIQGSEYHLCTCGVRLALCLVA
jgi:hypothetical protein